MRWLGAALGLIIAITTAPAVRAHEVRPAYLEIRQTGVAAYQVTWKQPARGEVAVHLVPHLSNGWLERPPVTQYAAAGFLIRTWTLEDAEPAPLSGVTVTIEGLRDTMTDVFVRLRLWHGQRLDRIVRPEAPSVRMSLVDGNAMAAGSFLLLGIEHILTGPDHLAFVLALLLIVRNRWSLLRTVSAFTAAHSLTLAAAALGAVTLPVSLLNTLTGLSILFLAPEVLRARRGGTSLTIRYPWVVAFAFGLVHGMAFAGGLTSLGLERDALVGALVLFNAGVEIGQIAFIALVAALVAAFGVLGSRPPASGVAVPAYVVGSLGALWACQYGAELFGMA